MLKGCLSRYVTPLLCSAHRHHAITSLRYLNSALNNNVLVSMDRDSGIATMKMNRKPVNGISLDLVTDLTLNLEKLEADKTCRGLILASNFPKTFCAGIDLHEFYPGDKERVVAFWKVVQDFWLKLYSSRLVTVAAICGHAPAGGCLLALTCDYRIMASGNYTMGLNETRLGIVAPPWLCTLMTQIIGMRLGERALVLGSMFTPEEAIKVGLANEIAVTTTEVERRAKEEIVKWLLVSDTARYLTKLKIHEALMDSLKLRFNEAANDFASMICSKETQHALDAYVTKLKTKGNKAV